MQLAELKSLLQEWLDEFGGSTFSDGKLCNKGLEERTRAALVEPDAAINQCDGCARGLMLRNGRHYEPDGQHQVVVMACTKHLYTAPSGAGELPSEPTFSVAQQRWLFGQYSYAEMRLAYEAYARECRAHAMRSRLNTFEEAARVCDGYVAEWKDEGNRIVGRTLAQAIRALKEGK